MRGKEIVIDNTNNEIRITPAYAGKRVKKSVTQSAGQDHPRLCGEKAFGNSLLHRCIGSPPPMRGKAIVSNGRSIDAPGSPPPMRGKVRKPLEHLTLSRITPAYAGKSIVRDKGQLFDRDHPRLCGEKRKR